MADLDSWIYGLKINIDIELAILSGDIISSFLIQLAIYVKDWKWAIGSGFKFCLLSGSLWREALHLWYLWENSCHQVKL